MESSKVDEDLEMRTCKQAFAFNRRVLCPSVTVGVCLLSIRSTRMEPLRPLVFFTVFHSFAALIFEWWADDINYHIMKVRLQSREYFSLAACAVGYYIASSHRSSDNEVVMQFVSRVLVPSLMVYQSEDFNLLTQLMLPMHLFLTCIQLSDDLWSEGGQQMLGLLAFHVLLFKMGKAQAGARESQDMLGSMYSTLRLILGTLCDGFLIIDGDNRVVGANGGAEVCLGMTSVKTGTELTGISLSSLFNDGSDGPPSAERPQWGLSPIWFNRPDSKRVKLEVCTLPCQLSTMGTSRLLEKTDLGLAERQPGLGQGTSICAVRIVEDSKKASELEPVASATPSKQDFVPSGPEPQLTQGPPMASLESPLGSKTTLAPLFFRSPWRFESLKSESLKGTYRRIEVPGGLGSGGLGSVYAAQSETGDIVAIKEISLSNMRHQNDFPLHLKAISREADALKKIAWASPVVIRLNDCWLQNDFTKACIVTEWLPHSLDGVLEKFRAGKHISVPKQECRRWCAHMVAGVAAIHSAGFVHRDIKPSNVRLTEDMQRCKIGGLGISRPLRRKSAYSRRGSFDDDEGSALGARSDVSGLDEDNCSMLSGLTGLTEITDLNGINAYSSPEMVNDRRHTEKTDIFSLGCIVVEMITLAHLSELNICSQSNTSPEAIAWSLVADARVRCFELQDESKDMQQLSVNCAELPALGIGMLNHEPNLRPTASEVVVRSERLQAYLPELIKESPKLHGALLKKLRKVRFEPAFQVEEDEWLGSDLDSGSELTPAVA